jgi:hypothetical protein
VLNIFKRPLNLVSKPIIQQTNAIMVVTGGVDFLSSTEPDFVLIAKACVSTVIRVCLGLKSYTLVVDVCVAAATWTRPVLFSQKLDGFEKSSGELCSG